MEMNLQIKAVTFETAKFCCEKYHYSKSMPSGKTIKYGVWEDNKFKGVVIFSRGSNNNLLKPYGLDVIEGCELTRVALTKHESRVTRIISICISILKRENSKLRLLVSFADSRQGHLGKIYQAGNWVYTGMVETTPDFFLNGRWMHQRSVSSNFGSLSHIPKSTPKRWGGYRLRYLYPLDKEMKKQILKLSKSYPAVLPHKGEGATHQLSGAFDSTKPLLNNIQTI